VGRPRRSMPERQAAAWWIEVWTDYAPDGRVTLPGEYRTMGAWHRDRERDGDFPAAWERSYLTANRARRTARSLVEQGAGCVTLVRLADNRSWSWERPDFAMMIPEVSRD
jgi:hypothetical protein